MNRAENQPVREWAIIKLVGAQVDYSAGFSTDDITMENPTENFHYLYIAISIQSPYMPVFTRHVSVENFGYSLFN